MDHRAPLKFPPNFPVEYYPRIITVGNFGRNAEGDATEDEIRKVFKEFGPVVGRIIILPHITLMMYVSYFFQHGVQLWKAKKCFAFVTFQDASSVTGAKSLNGKRTHQVQINRSVTITWKGPLSVIAPLDNSLVRYRIPTADQVEGMAGADVAASRLDSDYNQRPTSSSSSYARQESSSRFPKGSRAPNSPDGYNEAPRYSPPDHTLPPSVGYMPDYPFVQKRSESPARHLPFPPSDGYNNNPEDSIPGLQMEAQKSSARARDLLSQLSVALTERTRYAKKYEETQNSCMMLENQLEEVKSALRTAKDELSREVEHRLKAEDKLHASDQKRRDLKRKLDEAEDFHKDDMERLRRDRQRAEDKVAEIRRKYEDDLAPVHRRSSGSMSPHRRQSFGVSTTEISNIHAELERNRTWRRELQEQLKQEQEKRSQLDGERHVWERDAKLLESLPSLVGAAFKIEQLATNAVGRLEQKSSEAVVVSR